MKRLLLFATLVPFACLAQPLNTTNNPNLPGYQIPSQQRTQTRMLNQQSQQQGMLKQQMQSQTCIQQQHLQTQLDNNAQRVRQAQPGALDSGSQQFLPNIGNGMLNKSVDAPGQQHLLREKRNGDMLQRPQTTPLNP